MTFSEFAQTLYPYCGGGQNRSDFVVSLIKKIVEDDDDKIELPLDDTTSDYLGRLFSGRNFPQRTAAFILGHLDKVKFEGYISNLSDNVVEGLHAALVDRGIVITGDDREIPAKCADIFVDIMTTCARGTHRRKDKPTLTSSDAPIAAQAPAKSLVDVFEDAIDTHHIAEFIEADFTAEPMFVEFAAGAVDSFVVEMHAALRKFRRNQDATYKNIREFVAVLDEYNGYLSDHMFSEDGVVSRWISHGYDSSEERRAALGYRLKINRLYGQVTDGGSLSVFGYDSTEDEPVGQEAVAEQTAQTTNNTQIVANQNIGYQYGNNNKQIIGNVETLIINND